MSKKKRQLFIGVILKLLNKRGIKVKKASIQSFFFTFVQEQCPWFPEEGTVNLNTWEKMGKQLRDYYTLHGPERVPTDIFSLWSVVRDALDPTHESERVKVKENKDNAEPKSSYQQLKQMLAAMNINSHPENGEEKEKQLSPHDEEDLEEAAASYHCDEDWSFLAKDTPRSLRDTSPIRPSVKFNLKIPKASLEQGKKKAKKHGAISTPPCLPLHIGIRVLPWAFHKEGCFQGLEMILTPILRLAFLYYLIQRMKKAPLRSPLQ